MDDRSSVPVERPGVAGELQRMPVSIPVTISQRHVHLTAEVIEQLFCDHYLLHVGELTSQPRQFAALESVTLLGPTGRRLRNVRVIGPAQSINQIEISRTDAQSLGIQVPIREPGDLIGSPGITIEGPRARVTLGTGVICAHRHIHMSNADADRLTLNDRDRVVVSTEGRHRGLSFRDVLVRVSPHANLELHLDTDEANAAGLCSGDRALLVDRHA